MKRVQSWQVEASRQLTSPPKVAHCHTRRVGTHDVVARYEVRPGEELTCIRITTLDGVEAGYSNIPVSAARGVADALLRDAGYELAEDSTRAVEVSRIYTNDRAEHPGVDFVRANMGSAEWGETDASFLRRATASPPGSLGDAVDEVIRDLKRALPIDLASTQWVEGPPPADCSVCAAKVKGVWGWHPYGAEHGPGGERSWQPAGLLDGDIAAHIVLAKGWPA